MIIKGYEEKLDDRDIRYINYVIDKSTMADAIESYIKDLDCTIIYPDGSRPRQTINYGYRITLSSIEYILDKLYLVLEHHPEKAQSYIDYRNSIIKRIIDIHEKNLDFERRNPVRYYSKEPRKRTRSASRVNQSKDVFTGKPIDVSTGIAKAIKPKKETIAQRKAKLLGGKAVSFAFNFFMVLFEVIFVKKFILLLKKMVIKNLKVDIMRRLNKVINILMKYVICKIDPP